MLNFSVNFEAGSPIYAQVIYAVKKAIVSGQIKAGDPFPSVRELSKELRINPNTAQKIISYLERERILEIRPGIGSVVIENLQVSDKQKQNFLQEETEKLIVEAKSLLIKKRELIDHINKLWGKK